MLIPVFNFDGKLLHKAHTDTVKSLLERRLAEVNSREPFTVRMKKQVFWGQRRTRYNTKRHPKTYVSIPQ